MLFVTLYQRLPTNESLPKELHPVFFLFVAAPSVASMAWAKIHRSFDYGCCVPSPSSSTLLLNDIRGQRQPRLCHLPLLGVQACRRAALLGERGAACSAFDLGRLFRFHSFICSWTSGLITKKPN